MERPNPSSVGLFEDVLQAEVMLPQQFTGLWSKSSALTPVERLAMAMLYRAILDLAKYRFSRRLREQKIYIDAYVWVTAKREDEEGLSFVRICESFGIDPDAARKEMIELGAPSASDRLRTIEWEQAA